MDEKMPAMKKRKKGILQRQQGALEELQVESALCAMSLVFCAKGIMSGAQIHSIAQAAQKDIDQASKGFNVAKLKNIAKLKHSGNLGGGLQSMIAKAHPNQGCQRCSP